MKAYIKTDPENQTIRRPEFSGDAGYDLIAYSEPKIVGKTKSPKSKFYRTIDYIEYDTNVIVAPENESQYYSLVYPRSSISNYNLGLANSVGVIDGGYRDTIKVRFRYISQPEDLDYDIVALDGEEKKSFFTKINFDKIYKKGDKIAQLVWMNQNKLFIEFSNSIPLSERGAGGFGSTGF